jgi:hypothetical protein
MGFRAELERASERLVEGWSMAYIWRTIFPACRRDNSAVSALPASANGKTLATTGLSRSASHQRSNSARLRLIRAGSHVLRCCADGLGAKNHAAKIRLIRQNSEFSRQRVDITH